MIFFAEFIYFGPDILACLPFTGSVEPLTAYDKNGMKIVIHFGKDTPRPDVIVMVVSSMSTNTSAVKNFTFQAAVPKVCSPVCIVHISAN